LLLLFLTPNILSPRQRNGPRQENIRGLILLVKHEKWTQIVHPSHKILPELVLDSTLLCFETRGLGERQLRSKWHFSPTLRPCKILGKMAKNCSRYLTPVAFERLRFRNEETYWHSEHRCSVLFGVAVRTRGYKFTSTPPPLKK